MVLPDVLVSVGLPVYNGADRLEETVRSVLAQDHRRIELVISDNASTDGTEAVCRALAERDDRIVYHRQPANRGLLTNFQTTIRLARGTYFRWIGDDDTLAPTYVSRVLREFAADERRVLVTTDIAYRHADGATTSPRYTGRETASSDPVVRLTEMLRLVTEPGIELDPLYGMVRRDAVVGIERRNMLREDEVFATKLALAGPWGHVPEVLAERNLRQARLPDLARTLDVPAWQARVATALQCREVLRWIDREPLDDDQRRAAREAVARMYLRRHVRTARHRGRKLWRMAARRPAAV